MIGPQLTLLAESSLGILALSEDSLQVLLLLPLVLGTLLVWLSLLCSRGLWAASSVERGTPLYPSARDFI